MNKIYIICAGVKYKDHVIAGRRHNNAFDTLERLLDPLVYNSIEKKDIVCGFIDNWGDFHTRVEDWVIADKANQIKYGKGTQDPNQTPQLISEHLYLDKEDLDIEDTNSCKACPNLSKEEYCSDECKENYKEVIKNNKEWVNPNPDLNINWGKNYYT